MKTGLAALVLSASVLAATPPLNLQSLQELIERVRDDGSQLQVREQLHQAIAAASDAATEAYALAGLAMLHEMSGHFEVAEAGLREAASRAGAKRFLAETSLWFARKQSGEGRPNRVAFWARQAAREFEPGGHQRAEALQLVWRVTPAPRPRALLEELVAAARAAGDPRQLAEIDVERAEVLRADGQLGEAIATLRRAGAALESLAAWNPAVRAGITLARTYAMHGESPEALIAMRHALALAEKTGAEAVVMNARQELGTALAVAGRHREAIPVLDQVRVYVSSAAAPRGVKIRASVLALGFLISGEYQKAAEVAEQIRRQFPRRAAPALDWILSSAYYGLRRYDDSVSVATTGLARVGDQQNDTRIRLSYWRACSLDRLGKLPEAAHDIEQAMAMLDSMRGGLYPEDEWKRAFADVWRPMADRSIDILWRAGKRSEALDVAEQFRARAFLDLMASRGTAPSELEPVGRSEPRLSSTGFSSAAGRRQLTDFAAHAKEPLLSYWVHPDALYLWLVAVDGKIHGVRVPATAEKLSALVLRARAFRYKPDREAWRELYRLLIGPVRAQLPRAPSRLTLLLDGVLWQLPFAALMSADGTYLVEEFTLRSVPAAGFILPHSSRHHGQYLLVGAPKNPPPAASGKMLPALPAAQKELERLAALAPADRRVLSGGLARKAQVIEASGRAGVLHFATHALIDGDQPFKSVLALSERETLSVAEIYRLRLQADLVVLSACGTGSGAVKADGLLGFTRAFLYAGASTVIAPLWDLPDEPTARLVDEFYRQYESGASKPRALQAAQLKLLRDLRAGSVVVTTPAGPATLPEHPVLWASFALTGEI